jgi:hypothetical protein
MLFDVTTLTGDCLTSFEGESVTFGETFETEVKTKKLAQAPVKPRLQQLVAVIRRGNPHQGALTRQMVAALRRWSPSRQRLRVVLKPEQVEIVLKIVSSTGFTSRYRDSCISGRGLLTKTPPSVW